MYATDKRIGTTLAEEGTVESEVVCRFPVSGVPAALGYSEASGIPFDYGIIRNHYVGRTFIEPSDAIRHFGVRLKHSPCLSVLEGKRVILLDDSIVRGTTSRKIVDLARQAGAKEVHMRVASPPTIGSCFYGVDTPSPEELIAARMKRGEIAQSLNLDSLAFVSLDGLYRAIEEAVTDAPS